MTRRGSLVAGIGLALVVVIALVAMWAAGQRGDAGTHERSPLAATPEGSLAVAEVLRAQGVDVVPVHSYVDARAAMSAGDATLLIDDDWWVLTEEAYTLVGELGDHLVLVQPTDTALETLTRGTAYAGFSGGVVEPACDLPAAERAGAIDASGDAIDAPADAIRCYPSGDGGHALVRIERGGGSVTVLGAGDILRNDTVTEHGHAALALALLGERPKLVWYQPDSGDFAFEADDSLARYQADWYLPLVLMLIIVALAAIVWRGRRMGPVVVENLPVEVRASETMEGRARLYEREGARDHVLGTLRVATLARLARALGLPRTATDDEIIAAASVITGRDPRAVASLLTAGVRDDRALVHLSDDLLTLEHDVARGVAPR